MYGKISKLCAEHGISISKLENELGFGNGTVGKWRVSTPTVQKLKRVADYFQVPLESLIGDENADDQH